MGVDGYMLPCQGRVRGSLPLGVAKKDYMMIGQVRFEVNCDWEAKRFWETTYSFATVEELAQKSFQRLKEMLHYIYKDLESPLYMTRDISPMLTITVQVNKERSTPIEEALKDRYFCMRKEYVNKWRVA